MCDRAGGLGGRDGWDADGHVRLAEWIIRPPSSFAGASWSAGEAALRVVTIRPTGGASVGGGCRLWRDIDEPLDAILVGAHDKRVAPRRLLQRLGDRTALRLRRPSGKGDGRDPPFPVLAVFASVDVAFAASSSWRLLLLGSLCSLHFAHCSRVCKGEPYFSWSMTGA
jgi:hypothetical protein